MKLVSGLKRIQTAIKSLKSKSFEVYKKNKLLGIAIFSVWVLSAVILIPILWFIGGVPLVLAYLVCKLTGACPL